MQTFLIKIWKNLNIAPDFHKQTDVLSKRVFIEGKKNSFRIVLYFCILIPVWLSKTSLDVNNKMHAASLSLLVFPNMCITNFSESANLTIGYTRQTNCDTY